MNKSNFYISLQSSEVRHENSPHIGGFPPNWIIDPRKGLKDPPKLIPEHQI